MPAYELALIMRHALPRPKLIEAVKRSASEVMERGGFIRQLQYLGDRALPQRGSTGKIKGQTRGHYFMLTVDVPSKELDGLMDELQRDRDVMKKNFQGIDTTEGARDQLPIQCTLDEEYKAPAERPSVNRMLELGRKRPRHTKQWNPKTGMDFYPFHR